MIRSILLSILLASPAMADFISALVPRLSASDLQMQTQTQRELHAICSKAGRPGAEAERKAVCSEIRDALKDDLPVVVARVLVQNLERIGAAESVPVLVELLASDDEHLRDDARRALSNNPSPDAGKALMVQLKTRKARSAKETAGFIYALGERREQDASSLIAAYLSSRDDAVFAAAVKALGRIDEPEGIRQLAGQCPKEQGWRRTILYAALLETDRPAVFDKLYVEDGPETVRAVALLGMVVHGNKDVAGREMAAGDPLFQSAIIEAAAQCREPKLYDLVAVYLDKLPPTLQVQAMGVLEFSGNPIYARYAEPMLACEDASQHHAAAQALARIGRSESVSALLASGSPECIEALGRLHAEGVDQALEAVASGKEAAEQRALAIEALAMRGRQDLMPQFLAFAKADENPVARAGIAAVGSIGGLKDIDPMVELLLSRETSPLSRDILRAIVDLMRNTPEAKLAVSILTTRLEGASSRGQALLLQALAQVGSREALVPVAAACKSSDEKLQKQTIKLMGAWQNDDALPRMIELASDDSLALANHVVLMRGISRLLAGQRELDESLVVRALQTARRTEEKKAIIATLVRAKSPEAKAALQACLSDPELEASVQEALESSGHKKRKKPK